MKMLLKMCFVGVMLFLFSATVKAQSSAGFTVSATIVNPVGLRSEASYAYTEVVAKSGTNPLQAYNNKYENTVAEFKLDAAAEDVYSISIPEEMALCKKNGSSCITAVVNPASLVAAQLLPNGQKQFTVDSKIILGNEYVQGKHSSAPFEVTVNFN